MRNALRAVGLLTILGLSLTYCSPAIAEFQSASKTTSTTGTSALSLLTLSGGGVTISCGTSNESKNPATWTIEKGGVAATKGSQLVLKLSSPGKCVASTGESHEGVAASGSECSLEAKEPKEESKVPATVLGSCTFKVPSASCEVTMASASNKELSGIRLAHSGENDENLTLSYELTSVTTTVAGTGCAGAGISATTTGKLTGAVEAEEVAPEMLASIFRLSRIGSAQIRTVGAARSIFLRYTGGEKVMATDLTGLEEKGPTSGGGEFFAVTGETVAGCAGKTYTNMMNCTMKAKTLGVAGPDEDDVYFRFKILFMNRVSEVIVFASSS